MSDSWRDGDVELGGLDDYKGNARVTPESAAQTRKLLDKIIAAFKKSHYYDADGVERPLPEHSRKTRSESKAADIDGTIGD